MRKPPYKDLAGHGALRSRGPAGERYLRTGRLSYIWDSWLQSVLAGTAETTAEITRRRASDPAPAWHPLEATPDEVREYFAGYRLGGQLRIRRCTAIRERRRAKGLPLTGESTHDPTIEHNRISNG